jgi:ABC-type xylose transport system substrate-binding protein
MSEGAQDIENQISEIENEVKNNPNVLVDGDQMRTKIRSIIEQSSQKLVAKLRSEGKNETEIAKTKEFYVKYMLDIMGGTAVSEYSEETNANSGNMNELLDSTYGYGGRTFENMSMIPQTSN